MSIPQQILNKLEKYPKIMASLESAYLQPCFPQNHQVKSLEIFCDQKLLFRWLNGYLTHDTELPEYHLTKTIEWFIDGELALLIVETKTMLNRLKNGIVNPNINIPIVERDVNYVDY